VNENTAIAASPTKTFVGRGLLVGALLLLAIWLTMRIVAHAPPQARSRSEAATPVGASTATTGDMPVVLQGLGTVTPLATITVQSQISGQIVGLPFKEGQIVKRGDPLVEIDPRPYQVVLEQAQGALERDRYPPDFNRSSSRMQRNDVLTKRVRSARAGYIRNSLPILLPCSTVSSGGLALGTSAGAASVTTLDDPSASLNSGGRCT
jgi:multidrug efflux pump subunit AcrA (membrane-fusion protein)